jgi:hypothetical protein
VDPDISVANPELLAAIEVGGIVGN